MVTDPYKVLGVSKDATEDEIKKAYRKKAKECHPDLHPDDPHAQEKMNEVNEAYDMLKNPEKYRQQTFNGYQNPYGQSSYSGYQQNGQSYTYTYTNFYDFFNAFANQQQAYTIPMPNFEENDSDEIKNVISLIRSQNYQYASACLMNISSSYRNARWYYLYSLCCYGMGNRTRAFEAIQRCIQMEPGRQDYRQVYDILSQFQNTYYNQGFTGGPFTYQRTYRRRHGIFYYFIMFQLLMWFLRIFFGGFGYYDTRNNSNYYNGAPAQEVQRTNINVEDV